MQISSHWHGYAAHWHKLGSPLRPHQEDVHIYAQELTKHAPTLLLGVTPEIAGLPLSGVAVDNNLSMIQSIWPGPAGWQATQGNWLQLPVCTGAMQQAVGDGSLSMLRFPHEYPLLLAELRRAMHKTGKIVMRLFVAPQQPESVADIQHAQAQGQIRSFHALKWRLAMALGSAAERNVSVATLLGVFNAAFPDRVGMLASTGWSDSVFDTVDIYRGSTVSLSFPSQGELHAMFTTAAASVRYRFGNYELGERCPIVVLEGLRT